MKVKIGNKIYDSSDEPLMIVLNAEEKLLISNMAPEANTFCTGPSTSGVYELTEFMRTSPPKPIPPPTRRMYESGRLEGEPTWWQKLIKLLF